MHLHYSGVDNSCIIRDTYTMLMKIDMHGSDVVFTDQGCIQLVKHKQMVALQHLSFRLSIANTSLFK